MFRRRKEWKRHILEFRQFQKKIDESSTFSIKNKQSKYLIQRISTIDYVVKFQKQINFIEWNNIVFVIMFRRKLKNNVKNELIRWNEKFKNFNQLIETAIEFDDKLYKKIMKKRYNESREKTNIFVEHSNERRKKSRFNNRNHDKFNYYKSISMKLNSFNDAKKTNHSKINNKITETTKNVMHVINRVTSRKIVVQKNWCFNDKSMLHWK